MYACSPNAAASSAHISERLLVARSDTFAIHAPFAGSGQGTQRHLLWDAWHMLCAVQHGSPCSRDQVTAMFCCLDRDCSADNQNALEKGVGYTVLGSEGMTNPGVVCLYGCSTVAELLKF